MTLAEYLLNTVGLPLALSKYMKTSPSWTLAQELRGNSTLQDYL